MADIRINELPEDSNPNANDAVPIDGASTRKTTLKKLVDAGAPVASRAEAEAGTNAEKRMTPLTVRQAIDSRIGAEPGMIASANDSRLVAAFNYIKTAVKASQFCKGDGTNEDALFAQFFAALTADSRQYDGVIDLPIRLSSSKTLTGYCAALRWIADGSLTFTGGGNGLIVNNQSLTGANPNTFGLYDAQLFTTAANAGTAFRYRGSAAQSDNLIASIEVDGLDMMGSQNGTGWLIGLDASQVKKSQLRRVKTRGVVPSTVGVSGALDATSLFSIFLHDGCNQVTIEAPNLDWGRYGIYVGQDTGEQMSEGVVVLYGDVRAHRSGFVVDPTEGQQFASFGVHYDTSSLGVAFGKNLAVTADLSAIESNFFLRSSSEGYAGEYTAISLNADDGVVTSNRIRMFSGPPIGGRAPWSDTVGISIGSDTDPSSGIDCYVNGNSIKAVSTPIILRSSTLRCDGKNMLRPDGNPGYSGIVDNGTSNTVS